jgi:small subunit ribosomal protein S20
MPIKQAAKKSLRQDAKRLLRNRTAKAELHSLRVKLRKLMTSGNGAEVVELGKRLVQKIDKSVSRGILKKNTSSRLKSRMMKKVNAFKSK